MSKVHEAVDGPLPEHMERKGDDGLLDYRRAKDRSSIDGLAAFDFDESPG